MSIQEAVASLIDEGRLVLVPPSQPSAPCPRAILAMPDFYDELMHSQSYRTGFLKGDVDNFTEGGHIIVGERRTKHAHMKRLEPFGDEIWEFRSREPHPELRVFGRFAWVDTFIATCCLDRDYLGIEGFESEQIWRAEMVRCATDWRNLLPTYNPVHNGGLNDYISHNVHAAHRFGG